MSRSPLGSHTTWLVALLGSLLLTDSALAAPSALSLDGGLPILWAKSWLIGYALVFLCILLGMLALLIPSMRKVLRTKDT